MCFTGSTETYPGLLELRIFNSVGEHIKTLISTQLTGPYSYNVTWDGTNKYGAKCASGIYVIYLTEPTRRLIARVVVIH
jgi:hypothetical protein